MVVKILGIFDIFVGLVFIFSEIFNFVSSSFVMFLALFLLLKGIFFIVIDFDMISLLDVICGIFILISTAGVIPSLIIYIISIFLIQKGIFSLF